MERKRFRAAADFEVSYPHPIAFETGEPVTVGRTDATWPGWIWVKTADGNEGWAPLEALEVNPGDGSARARAAYTARELSMKKGDELESLREISGWLWVRNQRGEEGWVPAFNLKPL